MSANHAYLFSCFSILASLSDFLGHFFSLPSSLTIPTQRFLSSLWFPAGFLHFYGPRHLFSAAYCGSLNTDSQFTESSGGKSPLLWTWAVQVDYEIGVQVYTKNKGAIATRGRNTETEGRFIHQSQLTPVYAERPSAVMSIDAALRAREKPKGHKWGTASLNWDDCWWRSSGSCSRNKVIALNEPQSWEH